MRVVVAPDSFKGTIDADEAARALADGWSSLRPEDTVGCYPQADGGEGTAQVLASVFPEARWCEVGEVEGPDGRGVRARYLALPDGTAVVDLATTSGIALMGRLDPLGAHTLGLGQLLRRCAADGVRRILVGLGGSASTDLGLGALVGLGARALDSEGRPLGLGGGALAGLARFDRSSIVPAPPDGVSLLLDVSAPLVGPEGAAAVFGPQKGAGEQEIARLDVGLRHAATVLTGVHDGGDEATRPGAGAAGGTAFGLAVGWGATFEPGAQRIAELSGLAAALPHADVLLVGEGKFDVTSTRGKVVGQALGLAAEAGVGRIAIVAGQFAPGARETTTALTISLTEIMGGAEAAMAEPAHALRQAGAFAARVMASLPG
jgi:glycerate kinase